MEPLKSATRQGGRTGRERVLAAVKHSLAEGRYEGGMLPSYRQLARELNVTRANVLRAMDQLESEGLIRRENRRGVFPRTQKLSTLRKKSSPIQCVNFVARSFALLPSFVGADYLAGYTAALENLGVQMRFVAWDELAPDYSRMHSPILPMEAQGVILINEYPPDLFEWLRSNNVPFVLQACQRYPTQDLPPHVGVYVNKSGGAFAAVKHLLELGHRRIGFMGMVNSTGTAMSPMFDGYRAALVSVGLDCSENDLLDCQAPDRQSSFTVALGKEFLKSPRRPTAVIAACDEYALSLLEAAQALNLRVPEDLSIVGLNNQKASVQSHPPLTTLSVPRRELAKTAVELLLEVAANPKILPRTCILDTHLIIRETTAPPRAAHAVDSAHSLRTPS